MPAAPTPAHACETATVRRGDVTSPAAHDYSSAPDRGSGLSGGGVAAHDVSNFWVLPRSYATVPLDILNDHGGGEAQA